MTEEQRKRKAERLDKQTQLGDLLDSIYARKTPQYRRLLLKRYFLTTDMADTMAGFETFKRMGEISAIGSVVQATVTMELVKAVLRQGLTPDQQLHLFDFFKLVKDEAVSMAATYIQAADLDEEDG